MDYKRIIEVFKQNTGIGFISFPYVNAEGEKAKRILNIGISYENAKVRDLNKIIDGIDYVPSEKYTKADWDKAMMELVQSLGKGEKSEEHINRSNGQKDAYITLTENGAVKYGLETQELYIVGQSIKKTVTEAVEYKVVNSAPKTIAKNIIKSKLSTGKYRTFKVTNLIGNLKINGEVLEIE